MAVDFFEKEVERLQKRFNHVFGGRTVFDLRIRHLCIMAICRATLVCRQIRASNDEKEIGKLTREFRHIRESLHRCFDCLASEPERQTHVPPGDAERVIAGA